MPEAPTVAPVEAAKPVAPIEAPKQTEAANAASGIVDSLGETGTGIDTSNVMADLAAGANIQPSPEGAQTDLNADLASTPSLEEQHGQFNPDNVDEAAATELGINTTPKTAEAQTDTSTVTTPEPIVDEHSQEDNANPVLDTENPTPQPKIEGDIQPEPGEPSADKTNEPTKPLEGQQPEPTGEEDRQAEGETPEAQAKRRLEQGLEIAAKVIDLPGFEKGVPKALIEAIKDNPELIDALHGPLSQAESADQLVLNLTNEIRKLSTTEGATAASTAPETPNTPTETPGPQSPAAEGAPSNTPSSSGGENSTDQTEAGKKEAEKTRTEKLSKAKILLITLLLIAMGVSLSSVAAIPELK